MIFTIDIINFIERCINLVLVLIGLSLYIGIQIYLHFGNKKMRKEKKSDETLYK